MNRGRPRHDDILTPREWDVLALLREGLTNEEIAERLGVAHNTVKYHVSEILSKLEVETRQEAAQWRGGPRVAFGFAPLAGLTGKVGSLSPLKLAGAGAIGVAGVALVLLALGVLMSNGGASLGKIAFVRDGNIWVQELPDGTPYQLTDKGASSRPIWSPSGDWLSFTQEGTGSPGRPNLWVIKADGREERLIEGAGFTAYWLLEEEDRLVYYTEDGETIAEDPDGGNPGILSEPFTDSNGEKVARFVYPGLPIPDRIVYIEARYPADDDPRVPSEPLMQGFGVSNADGSNARLLLSSDAMADERALLLGWSSDGSQLIFSTYNEGTGEFIQDGLELQTMPIDGGPARNLGLVAIFTLPFSRSDAGWALVTGAGREAWTTKRIAIVEPDASGYTLLTGREVAALSPAWSPDGARIAFVANPELGTGDRDEALALRRLWVSDADGRNQRQLTFGDGFRDAAPMWSKDGKSILFARMVTDDPCYGGSYDLMRYQLDDGSLDVIATGLPLYGTWFDTEVGEIPECELSVGGLTTDSQGSLNLSPVLNWWQKPDE